MYTFTLVFIYPYSCYVKITRSKFTSMNLIHTLSQFVYQGKSTRKIRPLYKLILYTYI